MTYVRAQIQIDANFSYFWVTFHSLSKYILSTKPTDNTNQEFPGMRPSSGLARALKEQGHDIPLKKGKRSGLAMPEAGETVSEDDASHQAKRRKH